jgi:hypothetical protein
VTPGPASSVTELPAQTALLPVMVTGAGVLTVTVCVSLFGQPLASVTVTV